MKTVIRSTKFKKDFKRFLNRPDKVQALLGIVRHLEQTGRVPLEYGPHKLHGLYEGCMECHVGNNFLLIWVDEERNVIKLLRLGTHHELFGL